MRPRVFLTGGTGYMGRRLIPHLLEAGCDVPAVVRPGSAPKLPPGCSAILADALNGNSYARHIQAGDTLVHLVGVPHPSPRKKAEFEAIDFVSAREAIQAARQAGAGHFVYVSVAHPAPVMQAYWSVRARCEELLQASGLRATVLRPWYVLGPGHWWPLALKPFYFVAERVAATRPAAQRLGLLTIEEMTQALLRAAITPGPAWRVWDVAEIRRQAVAMRFPNNGPTAKRNGYRLNAAR